MCDRFADGLVVIIPNLSMAPARLATVIVSADPNIHLIYQIYTISSISIIVEFFVFFVFSEL